LLRFEGLCVLVVSLLAYAKNSVTAGL